MDRYHLCLEDELLEHVGTRCRGFGTFTWPTLKAAGRRA